MVDKWEKDGNFKILAENWGKYLILQPFKNIKTGEKRNYSLFCGEKSAVVVLALTREIQVVAIRQFRFGSAKIQIELPAGIMDAGEGILTGADRELLEETGYKAGKLIQLPGPLWLDPASFVGFNYPVLALNCEKVQKQKLDKTEEIDCELIPLTEWVDMIGTGEIDNSFVIATTYLAMLYL